MIFGKIKKVHFVGIGGMGMSGIAEVLLNLGFKVWGSDTNPSEITERLQKKGAIIYKGHASKNINNCDILVYSSAIKPDNVEFKSAKERNIPTIPRAEMLGELLKLKARSIAVGGTHGKTTTTSMIGTVFMEAKLDPTLIVGGVVKSLDVNAVLGSGEVIVAEADEFDRSFLKLHPTYAVITSIDLDHMDCYHDETDLLTAFTQFANSIPFYGSTVVCVDDDRIRRILFDISRPLITYGTSTEARFKADRISHFENSTKFRAWHNDHLLGEITLMVPGEHNVKNALAAIAVGFELDLDFRIIQQGLSKFAGVRRRFEIKGIFEDIMIVDDYAHHPTEVSATLEGIRKGWKRRLVCVFQPHLYSRTRDLYRDFAKSFLTSDVLVVTDIYPAREEPIEGVTGKLIADEAISLGHKNVHWIQNKQNISPLLNDIVMPGDVVIMMGAGDIWRVCHQFANLMEQRKTTAFGTIPSK